MSSQADTEHADLERERRELASDPEHERAELAAIYVSRGLDVGLAGQVAEQLMTHDALAAHVRDELGISEVLSARPIQAALTSACTFALGAILPILAILAAPGGYLVLVVSVFSLACLAGLGVLAALVGGANVIHGTVRVTFWGALAMALTAGVGAVFGVAA